MNENEKKMQELIQEAVRWKQRALDACEKACFNCEEYRPDAKHPCDVTSYRVYQIKEAAGE